MVNNFDDNKPNICIKKIYKEEKDAIEIIKWTSIFDCFENAMDACEQVADEMADVIMKNS